MTALYFLKAFIFLLLVIVLLPLILLWFGIRYVIFQWSFRWQLRRYGMPKEEVRDIARGMGLSAFWARS